MMIVMRKFAPILLSIYRVPGRVLFVCTNILLMRKLRLREVE